MGRSLEERAKPRPRIESLSDLIFGLALSIGAFALVSNPTTTSGGFDKDVVTFAFNFLVLITVWIRYTRIMSALPVETKTTMLLNVILLFTVSLEPYIFNTLRLANGLPASTPLSSIVQLFETASASYGVDLGAMMLIMGVFTLALADEEKRLVPDEMLASLKSESTLWFVASGIFLASALPVFGKVDLGGVLVTGFSLRMLMWLAAILVTWVRR
jgi:uncharacterized membrane protein